MDLFVKNVRLEDRLSLRDFMAVVRDRAKVEFAPAYTKRVNQCRSLVEKWVAEERVIYGTTTGFGSLVSQMIPPQDAETLQRRGKNLPGRYRLGKGAAGQAHRRRFPNGGHRDSGLP